MCYNDAMTLIKGTAHRVSKAVVIVLVIIALAATAMNIIIVHQSAPFIVAMEDADLSDADCIVVLGAGYINDYTPSNILADRIDTALQLHSKATGVKLLMSGDSEDPEEHDEALVMCNYAHSRGISDDAIIADGYGINTYDSIWRARFVYGADTVVISTQKYHLYRAIYIARMLGMKAYGVDCSAREYRSVKLWYDFREVIARCKDYLFCLFRPQAKYLNLY